MSLSNYFRAPWSGGLKVMSLIATAVLVGVLVYVVRELPPELDWDLPVFLYLGLSPIVLLVSALFAVRGYSFVGLELRVHRLLWQTSVSLEGLKDVRADPSAMRRSLRLFGNGGIFSYTGRFVNRRLGRYRAFATDPSRSVVLELSSRTIVVTPEDPSRFVMEVQAQFPQRDLVSPEATNERGP